MSEIISFSLNALWGSLLFLSAMKPKDIDANPNVESTVRTIVVAMAVSLMVFGFVGAFK